MNDDLRTDASAVHARCWNLLPWWVNGTLSADEAHGVEEHLSECSECAAELSTQRGLQAQMRNDAVLMAPQSAWQKMAERLDREDEVLTRGHVKQQPKSILWPTAVAAQMLLVVGLSVVVWQQAHSPSSAATQADARQQPRYETLTAATNVAPTHDGVRVVFRRDVAMVEVNILLRDLTAQIVAGPSEAGVYTLALPAATNASGAEQAAALLKRLRNDARVVFAEPTEHR